jgi:hypothetical protein
MQAQEVGNVSNATFAMLILHIEAADHTIKSHVRQK